MKVGGLTMSIKKVNCCIVRENIFFRFYYEHVVFSEIP